jgi:hypothetical protein
MALAITNDDHRAEAEAPATLHHFGHAINLYDALFKIEPIGVDSFSVHASSHNGGD